MNTNCCDNLFMAVCFNHPDCIIKLFDKKHLPIGNVYGKTPLHYAAEFGYIDCIKILLEYNAQAFCDNDKSPLEYAKQKNHIECVELLSKYFE